MAAIGKLNRRIEIQTFTRTQNSFGEESKSWSTSATVWARIEPSKGKEYFDAQQVKGKTSYKVTIRKTDISTDDRLKYGSKIFEIDAILDTDTDRRYLEIMCYEV